MHSGLTTLIIISQLMMDMWIALASHMDVIPGSISGLLQLLFMRHLTILAALFLTFLPIYSLVYEDGGNSLILSSVNIKYRAGKIIGQ